MKKINLHLILILTIIISLLGLTYSQLNFNKEHSIYATYLEQTETNSNNLVAYYSFNENSDTILFDHSKYNNNATINGATYISNGFNDGAFSFDGINDYIMIPNSNLMNTITNQITVTAWIYKTNEAGATWETIVQRGEDGTDDEYFYLGLNQTSKDCIWIIKNEIGSSSGILHSPCSANQWHHITGTYNGSDARLYIDGQLSATSSLTGNLATDISTTTIGAGNNSGTMSDFFSGNIDEVRIYNTALSEEEVGKLYSQKAGFYLETTLPTQKPSCDSNTVALYHFDGTTDESCNQHHATFNSPALKFDGTDDCINISALDVTNNRKAITISAWVNADTLSVYNSFYASSINNGGIPTGSSRAQISLTAAGNVFLVGRSTDVESVAQFTSAGVINTGEWHHIIGIIDFENNRAKIFIDGIQDSITRTGLATFGSTSTPATNSASSSIGAEDACTASNLFDGAIDELKVYGEALTNEQAYKLYKNQPIDDTNLLLYYPFNDISGATLTDASGNGGNGELKNFIDTTAYYGVTHSSGWAVSEIIPPYTKGKFGNSLNLGKGDMTRTDHDPSYDLPTFTISGWFKTNSIPSTSAVILTKTLTALDRNYIVLLTNATNTLRADFTAGGTPYWIESNTQIENNKWYYFTFILDENGYEKLYLNGNLEDSIYVGVEADTQTIETRIGGAGLTNYFDGTIDEIKISSEVLSPDKIMQNYLNGKVEHTTIDLENKKLINDISWSGNEPVSSININDKHLVGYWAFENNLKDSTGHTTVGSLIGTESDYLKNGKVGQGFYFNGTTNYISIPEYPEIDIVANEDFTISVWVKTNQQAAASSWPVIIKHEYTSGSRKGYNLMSHLDTTNTKWFLEIYVSGTDYKVFGANDIADGKWHHLVGMRKGTNLITYEDGEYAATTSAVSSTISIVGPLIIGGYSNAVGDYEGYIDEVAFYDKALDADEVKNLYQSSKTYLQIEKSDDDFTYTPIQGNKPIPYEYEENKTLFKLPLNQNLKGYDNEQPIKPTIYDKKGLIGYWNFDNDMKDYSGNKNDITIWNKIETRDIEFGKSLYFDELDNDQAAIIPFDYTFNVDKKQSISYFIWFKKETDCDAPDLDNEVMLNRFGSTYTNTNWWFGCQASNDQLHIEIYPTPATPTSINSPQIIDDGEWHLGGWTLNGVTKNLSLYIDGVVVNSTIISSWTNNLNTVNPICIGSFDYSPASGVYCGRYKYNGYLDELSIWKKALTEEEAYALYTETKYKYGQFLSGKEITGATNLIYPTGTSIDDNTVLNCKFEDGVLCDTGQKGEIITDYSNMNGLTGYWPLENDATDLVNSNDGTLTSVSFSKDSYSQKSADFDGTDDYITIPADSTLDFDADENFSFFMWVRNNGICDSPEANQNEVFATRKGPDGSHWWLGCDGSPDGFANQTLRIHFEGDDELKLASTTLMNNTNWHQIGWTYDGTTKTLSLYHDGQLEVSKTNASYNYNFTSSNPLCIGGYQGGGATCNYHDANANIDDVMSFNKTLTATEIQNLYTRGQGKYGEAFKTDGHQYIELEHDESYNIQNEITIGAWIYPTFDDTTIQYHRIIDKSGLDNNDRSYRLLYSPLTKSWYFLLADQNNTPCIITLSNEYTKNQWEHLIATYDGSYMKMYVNGILTKTSGCFSGKKIGIHNTPLSIGADFLSTGSKQIFNGSIDEVFILNKALSAQEVYNEYSGNIKATQGTISLMFKPNWNGNDNTAHTLFDEGNFKIYKDTSNNLHFKILGDETSSSITSLTANTWYRIDATWDSSTMNIYIDGTLQDSTPTPVATINLNSYMFIGNSITQDETCDCTIDDFNIFNYAKTQLEINPTGFTNQEYELINTSARFLKIKSIFETNNPYISPAISYFTINSSTGIQYSYPTPKDESNINLEKIIFNASFSYTDITSCTLNMNGVNYPMTLNSNYCNYTFSPSITPINTIQYNITYVKSAATYSLENRTLIFYPDVTQENVPFGSLLTYLVAISLILIGGLYNKK